MKKWIYVLYGLLLLAVIGFLAYKVFYLQNAVADDYIQAGLLIIGLILSFVKIYINSNQSTNKSIKAYQDAFQGLIGTPFTNDSKLQKKFYTAVRYYSNNHLARALKILDSLLPNSRSSTDRFAILVFKALCFDDANQLDLAIEYYEKALLINEKSTLASNLGLCYANMGNLNAAAESYERSIRLDSKNEYPPNNYAQLLIKMADYDKALIYAQKALDINGSMPQALNAMAICHAMLGNKKEYESYFRRAVACGSNAEQLKSFIDSLQTEL